MGSVLQTPESLKRCASQELVALNSKLPRANQSSLFSADYWREIALRSQGLAFCETINVYLVNLDILPSLNDEHCRIIGFDSETSCIRVRRVCVRDTLLVSWRNLALSPPDGLSACVDILTRALGQDMTSKILSMSICQRCWKPCSRGSTCRVPHPPSQREILGNRRDSDGRFFLVCRCKACQVEYRYFSDSSVTSSSGDGSIEWCYAGEHTLCKPRDGDLRQCISRTAEIFEDGNPNLQAELDELPNYVESLSLKQYGPDVQVSYEDYVFGDSLTECSFILRAVLMNLKVLRTNLLNFEPVLSEDLTPNLEEIWIERTVLQLETPSSRICLPNLKSVHIGHCSISPHYLNDLLLSATKLEVLSIVNLEDICKLDFASNVLRKVFLYGVNELRELSFWAPNLRSLILPRNFGQLSNPQTGQICESQKVLFLADHDLKAALPIGYSAPRLTVHTSFGISEKICSDVEKHSNMNWGWLDWEGNPKHRK